MELKEETVNQTAKKNVNHTTMLKLKKEVFDANIALVKHGLVLFTWGNVSAIDRSTGLVAIKPSGVAYSEMKPDDIVILDLNGNIVEGKLRPSSDTPTHLELYRAWQNINAVVHTHSTYATAWAQSGRAIQCYGTTHADYFYGAIPCTRPLTKEEVETDYETNTGKVIIETFQNTDASAAFSAKSSADSCTDLSIDPCAVPAVVVANHGPFAWGKTTADAVHNAVVLEEVARIARLTECLNPSAKPAADYLLNKHYLRKHGKNAYYGQKKATAKSSEKPNTKVEL